MHAGAGHGSPSAGAGVVPGSSRRFPACPPHAASPSKATVELATIAFVERMVPLGVGHLDPRRPSTRTPAPPGKHYCFEPDSTAEPLSVSRDEFGERLTWHVSRY